MEHPTGSQITRSVPSKMVRKNVGAIHVSGDLTLIAHRLSNALLYNAYWNLNSIPVIRTHSIKLSELMKLLSYESKNTAVLKGALIELMTTCIEFNLLDKSGKEKWKAMTILSFAEVTDGLCSYRYDEEMEVRLRDPEVYAFLSLEMQNRFSSTYALRLYENCNRFRNTGSTGLWSLPMAKRILGANSSSFDEFKRLKQRVIDTGVNEVNAVSDINVRVQFTKDVRTVVGMTFLVEPKLKTDSENSISAEEQSETTDPLLDAVKQCGIPESLAHKWLDGDRLHLQNAVRYVREREKAGKISGSVAGYLRYLVENRADMSAVKEISSDEGVKLAEEKKEAKRIKDERLAELRTEFSNLRFAHMLEDLSDEQWEELANKYKGSSSKCFSSFDISVREFGNRTDQILFKGWLRTQLTPVKYAERDFKIWLKKRNDLELPLFVPAPPPS